jgi:hypothetical protein
MKQKADFCALPHRLQFAVEHEKDALHGIVDIRRRNAHAPQSSPYEVVVFVDEYADPVHGDHAGRGPNKVGRAPYGQLPLSSHGHDPPPMAPLWPRADVLITPPHSAAGNDSKTTGLRPGTVASRLRRARAFFLERARNLEEAP